MQSELQSAVQLYIVTDNVVATILLKNKLV
jgi:hypothetical protein